MVRCKALVLSAVGIAGLLVSSCGSSHAKATIVVDKPRALIDVPVAVRVTGLEAGTTVTISASATDAFQMVWHSKATFRAKHGTVDLTHAESTGGTYEGIQPMGFLTSMRPTGVQDPDKAGSFIASRVTRVVVRASIDHRPVATRAIERLSLTPEVKLTRARPKADGFFGDYFRAPSRTRRPAVVALGGSEGGISTVDIGRALSSHGYPTLALAYFKEPGLPKQIARIPLEYFAGAVRWLRRRPEVDPRRVVVLGISAGTVPAMLTGMHSAQLVRGVVVYAPSGYVLPGAGRDTPPWTLRGRPLSYVRHEFSPLGEGPRDAMLHPEKVNGPVMMVSGGADRLLPATDFASRMWALLGGVYSRRKGDVWLNYPYAGHGVGGVIPYLPSGTVFDTPEGKLDFGGTAEATADARADSWPKLLKFLRGLR